ncbi:MAG: 5'/3'-nucleotidase SurE [Planctomycetales bacterium]|nr:5'/3'-nucleotidase SurE [Planctomycetales bacterium]
MRILLTNDDGVYAPGLAALRLGLAALGEVHLIAPATEQSGVGHSITFLEPLVCKQIYREDELLGTAVEGSPADCVKLGVSVLIDQPVDLVVSGINGGLNAGINVLYSGTVAAAIEGAFFRLNSFAVSLEYDPHADFHTAARIAIPLIAQILQQKESPPQLYNINIPTVAVEKVRAGGIPQVHAVPMGVERYGEHYIRRQDPKGRDYYWATNDPPPRRTDHPTDLTCLADGHVTVSPLRFDMTDTATLVGMQDWNLSLDSLDSQKSPAR